MTFFAAALCLTLQLPSLSEALDRALSIPNAARLFANIAGVFAAWSFCPCMVQVWELRPRKRQFITSVWLMSGTIATLIVLFIFVPADPTPALARRYVASPFTMYEQSLAYTLVYMTYLGAIVLQVLLLSLRSSRRIARSPLVPPRLRLQLRAQTAGWAAGVAFAAHECIHALLRKLSVPYPVLDPALVSNGLLAAVVIGVTSGELHAPWHWAAQYRAYRRLYPLWRMLYEATPAIALVALYAPPRSTFTDAMRINDVALRLLRRVMEIRDGILALRPFCDEHIAARADRLESIQNKRGEQAMLLGATSVGRRAHGCALSPASAPV